jgi:hypothetical protein
VNRATLTRDSPCSPMVFQFAKFGPAPNFGRLCLRRHLWSSFRSPSLWSDPRPLSGGGLQNPDSPPLSFSSLFSFTEGLIRACYSPRPRICATLVRPSYLHNAWPIIRCRPLAVLTWAILRSSSGLTQAWQSSARTTEFLFRLPHLQSRRQRRLLCLPSRQRI